jgi:hypothetical protein
MVKTSYVDTNVANKLENYQNRFKITGYSTFQFTALVDFEEIIEANLTTYYAVDFGNSHVVLFNENWEYQTYKTTSIQGSFVKVVDNELYIVGDSNFYKTDKDVNVTESYQNSGAVYRGLYFNKRQRFFCSKQR